MPRRRGSHARPEITFINSCSGSGTGSKESRLLARRHASYWGHKRSRTETSSASPHSSGSSSLSDATTDASSLVHGMEEDEDHHSLIASLVENSTATSLDSHAITVNLRFGSGFDSFHSLPQIWSSSAPETQSELLSISSIMHDFFGDSFLRHTVLRDGESCNSRYAACLLLCYAYYMAMTGAGSYESFVWLKGNVIQQVREALADPGKTPTLDTMIAVMALGTPIVCQVTASESSEIKQTELAASRVSSERTSPTAVYSPISVESSTTEYDMHYQAVTRLLRMQPDPGYLTTPDGRFVFLVKVLSNAHRMLLIPNLDTEAWIKLFLKFELYSTTSVPDPCWTSPVFGSPRSLRSREHDSPVSNSCIDMAVAVRNWFLQYKKMRRRVSHELEFARSELEHKLDLKPSVERLSCTDKSLAMYEACFIASTVMTEASDRRCSVQAAAEFIPNAAQLPQILKRTDLLHLWGDLRGLLYWVTLVCHIISSNGQERNTSTFILAHFTQAFASSRVSLAAALTPIKELLEYPRD